MPMPTVIYKFQDCLSSELRTLPIVAGTLIYCRDTGENWYDTLEGTRISVSRYVVVFQTDSERTSYLEMSNDTLYIVVATRKLYVYSGGWICLNGSSTDTFYFDVENVEVPSGATGTTVTDGRILDGCSGTFVPIPSLTDLFTGATVTCSTGSATIKLTGTNNYPIIGTLKISGSIYPS